MLVEASHSEVQTARAVPAAILLIMTLYTQAMAEVKMTRMKTKTPVAIHYLTRAICAYLNRRVCRG